MLTYVRSAPLVCVPSLFKNCLQFSLRESDTTKMLCTLKELVSSRSQFTARIAKEHDPTMIENFQDISTIPPCKENYVSFRIYQNKTLYCIMRILKIQLSNANLSRFTLKQSHEPVRGA